MADLLTDVGGMFSALYSIMSIFGGLMNRHFIVQKVSRAVYYFTSQNRDHRSNSEISSFSALLRMKF